MAIAIKTEFSPDQVVRLKVSWSAYETLVESLGDQRQARLTYDGEILEIMSPGSKHEFLADAVSQMLAIVIIEWQVPLAGYGSTTFKAEPQGFEADRTYYLSPKGRVRDVWNLDITIDPPPDLLVEIDITSSSSNRFVTYAGAGVPEVWRYKLGEGLRAFILEGAMYAPLAVSRMISGLPVVEIANHLERAEPGDLAFLAAWQQWLGENRHLHKS